MGTVRATTIQAGTIRDADIAEDAGIEPQKMQHQHLANTDFDLGTGATPTTQTRLLFVARGPGSLRSFMAMLVADGSSTSITVDLQKNGVSVLSAVITLTHSTGDNTPVDGTINTSEFIAGDRFTVVMTVSSATGATGPFAQAMFDSDYV